MDKKKCQQCRYRKWLWHSRWGISISSGRLCTHAKVIFKLAASYLRWLFLVFEYFAKPAPAPGADAGFFRWQISDCRIRSWVPQPTAALAATIKSLISLLYLPLYPLLSSTLTVIIMNSSYALLPFRRTPVKCQANFVDKPSGRVGQCFLLAYDTVNWICVRIQEKFAGIKFVGVWFESRLAPPASASVGQGPASKVFENRRLFYR